MKAQHALIAAVASVGIASSAMADQLVVPVNVTWPTTQTGLINTTGFALPDLVSIDSIVVEMSHTWGADIQMSIASPAGNFVLMNNNVSTTASGNFDLGLAAGSGALANVAPYTFNQAGPTQWISPFSASGTYNAVSWISGPIAAGAYTFSVSDTEGGDGGSIGNVIINYTVPAPGALALLGLAGLVGTRRRRN